MFREDKKKPSNQINKRCASDKLAEINGRDELHSTSCFQAGLNGVLVVLGDFAMPLTQEDTSALKEICLK